MSVPHIFANATSSIPLAELDENFAYFTDAMVVDGGNNVDFTNNISAAKVSADSFVGTSQTIASAATITPTAGTTNQYTVTALATGATIAAPSGTPIDGQRLIIRIKDNGTARSLTWTTTSGAYRAVGVTLPVTTVLGKVLYVGCIYNSQDNFWDVIATAQQA